MIARAGKKSLMQLLYTQHVMRAREEHQRHDREPNAGQEDEIREPVHGCDGGNRPRAVGLGGRGLKDGGSV